MQEIPSLLHEQLTEKLENLDDSTLKNIQTSLELLEKLLELDHMEASPLIANDDFTDASLNS
jgi:hypothetical protein